MVWRKYPECLQGSHYITEGKGLVYCYHCIPTGKKYIGSTHSLTRWSHHHIRCKEQILPFHIDVMKYGWENFTFGVVEVVDDLSVLRVREKYWMKELNTEEEGYNRVHTPDYGKYMGEVKSKTYELEFIDGRVERVTGLKRWCKDNQVPYVTLWKVKTGQKTTPHRGIVRVTELTGNDLC